jgi:endonuclease G
VRSYTIAFDSSTRQPLWVAYPMHSWYDGDAGRGTTWRPDPLIPESEQPYLRTSYNEVGNNGAFSRGHMLASDSRQRSRAMNDQTFLFTNSAPQAQNTFNGGVWLKLENLEKEWGFRGIAARDTLYVVTGSTFGGLTGEGGASEGGSSGADMGGGSDGGGEKITSDDRGNTIPVPTHFYKAMLTTKGSGVGKAIGQCSAAELKCVVFYLEHFGHAGSARPSTDHMMSVADLEAAIGIEFFPTIAPAARSVKLSFDPAEWAGVAQSN